MSSAPAPGSAPAPTPGPAATQAPRRTMMQLVTRATLARWGARIGLVWILAIAGVAVFGPLIANSQPLAVKVDGAWSSPMAQHLGALDVALLVLFPLAIVLWLLRPVAARWRALGFVGAVVVVSVVCAMVVSPPSVVQHNKWRKAVAAGEVDAVVWAPIPYSANDRMVERSQLAPVGPWWAGHDYNHWLGQDPLNQDLASRMIHATRIALAVGFIATGLAMTIGILVGAPMGYFAGVVDLIGMRLVEVFEFIPQLYLLLIFAAFFPGDNPEILPGVRIQRIYLIMGIIGLTGWAGYARYVRAEFLKLRKQDFVQAARACGLPLRSVLFRHMLPNGLAPVLVSASFGVAAAILAEATLSFLGLGLIEDPSWGQLLNQAVRNTTFLWWMATFPGLAIFLTVFAYNLLGEALRDAIDPHTQGDAGGRA